MSALRDMTFAVESILGRDGITLAPTGRRSEWAVPWARTPLAARLERLTSAAAPFLGPACADELCRNLCAWDDEEATAPAFRASIERRRDPLTRPKLTPGGWDEVTPAQADAAAVAMFCAWGQP